MRKKFFNEKGLQSLIVLFIFLSGLTAVFLVVKNFYHGSTSFNDKSDRQIEVRQETIATGSAAKSELLTKEEEKVVIPQHSGRQVKVPILTYHYIGNNPNPSDLARDNLSVPPDKFEEQMKYLSENGYQTIFFESLYSALKNNATLPDKSIILTFDDGYMDFYTTAYPVLKNYNLRAVVFIPTALMGGDYYLTWEQVQEMDKSNLISFQSHSVNHVNLADIPVERVKFQAMESKKVLEQKLGKVVNTFAYPYGGSNSGVWGLIKEAGYFGAVGTWYGREHSEGVIYNMPRIKIPGSINLAEFKAKL